MYGMYVCMVIQKRCLISRACPKLKLGQNVGIKVVGLVLYTKEFALTSTFTQGEVIL